MNSPVLAEQGFEEINKMAVYTIYDDRNEDEASGNYGYVNETLDGDFSTAFPVGDYNFHPVTKAARLDDGTRLKKISSYQGGPVDMNGLPKRVRWGGGERDLGDFQITASHFLVSGKMKDAIEALEPDIHQYQPVELIWEDDSHAANFFWFNPCNRIDGMDREHTTHDFNEKIRRWIFVEGKKYVVNQGQTVGMHVWVDSRIFDDAVFVSGSLKRRLDADGIKGVALGECNVI